MNVLDGFKRVDGRIVRYRYRAGPSVPPEEIETNLISCLARRLPFIHQMEAPLPHAVAIVAGGPSVVEDLETIRNWKGFVVSINGAHDWLQENGITPGALILCDPAPLLAGYCQHPNDTTIYLVHTFCNPSVFDALQGKRVVLWHLPISGPITCATIAPHILHVIGFRELHLFGVDSSFVGNKTHGVLNFGKADPAADPVLVRVGNEVFVTEVQLAMQAQYLWHLVDKAPADTKVFVHGSGLGPAVVAGKGKFEVLPPGVTPAPDKNP
jgi:Protein of unknown function DUF115